MDGRGEGGDSRDDEEGAAGEREGACGNGSGGGGGGGERDDWTVDSDGGLSCGAEEEG